MVARMPQASAPAAAASPGSRRRWLGRIWRPLRFAAICYLMIVLLAMLFERQLVFVPTRYPGGDWEPQGLAIEDAWFESPDGLRLHGWYVPHERPRAVILLCHGNAGNVTHRIDILRALHDRMDASVLVFDYRGYGRSEGSPDEAGVLADARAARTWLARREGIAETQIVQMGESLGGAVAVDLAAADGARALVLQSTFSSAPDVAAWHYPWLPVRWLMRTRLDAASKIANYRGPLLAAHSEADTIVPYWSGRKLFDAAHEPKQFVDLRGDHNTPLNPAYLKKLTEFLDTLDPPRQP